MRYFCAVVESGHLRKASELLNISPGALSNSLRKLQESSGLKLLTTVGRNIQVTSEGKEAYKRFKKILEEIDAVFLIREPAENKKIVTIGTFEVFSTYLMAECAEELDKEHAIRCVELGPEEIESAVMDSEVDLGITYVPVPHPQISYDRICTFSFGVFGNRSLRDVHPSDLEFAVPTTSLPQNPGLLFDLDTWPSGRVPRKVRFRFEMLQTALLTSAKGLSALYCPKFVVKHYNSSAHPDRRLVDLNVHLPTPQKHSVYLVRRKDRDESTFYKRLAKHLRILCRDD